MIDFQMEHEGLTGFMKFDERTGQRTYFRLDLIELVQEGFKKIGTWDPVNGINHTRTAGQMYSDIVQSITTKNFLVASRIVSNRFCF